MNFHVGDNAQPQHVVKKRVLILDDNRALAGILTLSLKASGYDAQGCTSPKEALKEIHRFDVLVSDFHMPEMTGLEVAQRAYELGWRGSLFLMSGHRKRIAREIEHPLLRSFLEKPFSGSELVAIIGALD